ncbi:hypothetical protein [Streptomonospora arabica]|uniref:Uncharacterized protein n=1 Tax=Streptomonospora arabica TaxID=412417 RepID=A0ABV9SGC5_9ACTN
MDSLDSPALLISNPFVSLALRFPLVIVGVLALALAGRASAMRGPIRTGGGLLILSWIVGLAFSVFMEFGSFQGAPTFVVTVFNVVSILTFCAALILLLIALAGSGRASAQRGAAAPHPAGAGGWPPQGSPGAGQYAQVPGPGRGPADPAAGRHGAQPGPYGQPPAPGGPGGAQYAPGHAQPYGPPPPGGQQPGTGPQQPPAGHPGPREQPGQPPAGPPRAQDPRT